MYIYGCIDIDIGIDRPPFRRVSLLPSCPEAPPKPRTHSGDFVWTSAEEVKELRDHLEGPRAEAEEEKRARKEKKDPKANKRIVQRLHLRSLFKGCYALYKEFCP